MIDAEFKVNAPRIVGLGDFVCKFTTRVDGKLHRPVHEVDEGTVDMTKLLTFKCYIKCYVFEEMKLSPAELGTRIFNYVQSALPSPRMMGAVNFGFQIILTDREGNVLPDAEQPALPPSAKQLTESTEDSNGKDQ